MFDMNENHFITSTGMMSESKNQFTQTDSDADEILCMFN